MFRRGGIVLAVLILAVFSACRGEEVAEEETTPQIKTQPVVEEAVSPTVLPKTDSELEKEETGKEARIEFDETEFDFGEVDSGEKVEHIFKFRNTGNAELIIAKVRSS